MTWATAARLGLESLMAAFQYLQFNGFATQTTLSKSLVNV
jgi:hypothetical protein